MSASKPRLVFLTDHYFPYEVGGAERSLRIVIGELRHHFEIRVVALVGDAQSPSQDSSVDGVPVTYLSCLPVIEWKDWGRAATPVQRFLVTAVSSLGYLFKKTRASLWQKVLLTCCNLYSSLFCMENYESLDEDYDRLVSLAPLRNCLEQAKADLVVCDNTRSILLFRACGLATASLAIVRDLKFSCPRRKVIAHSAHGPCENCSPRCNCMLSLPPLIRAPLTQLLFQNKEFRLRCLGKFDAVLTTSQFLKSTLEKAFPLPIHVIPNSVGTMLPETVPRGPARDGVRILFVGMLTSNKGPDILIRAFGEFLKENPGSQLLIAGRPSPYFLHLPELVHQLKLENHVQFLGFVEGENLSELYSSAHIVVCPTRWPEPFGRVPLEAMNHGCLVVASRSGAFPETISDGKTGFLFHPMDERDLQDKLRTARTALESSGPLLAQARASLARYSLETVAQQYESLITATIG